MRAWCMDITGPMLRNVAQEIRRRSLGAAEADRG